MATEQKVQKNSTQQQQVERIAEQGIENGNSVLQCAFSVPRKYTLRVPAVARFEQRLETFKRKFEKYGHGTITYTKSEPYIVEQRNHTHEAFIDIEVCGSYQVCDFEFVASLEWNDEARENIVLLSPSVGVDAVPDEYRFKTDCEHCHTNRARKYTVLLRHIHTGKFIQIGRSCCKDYFGQDIGDYAAWLSFADDLDEDASAYNAKFGGETWFTTSEVLQQTCAYVKKHGYISKAAAFDSCGELKTTASSIWTMMYEIPDRYGKPEVPKCKLTDADIEQANTVLEFVGALDAQTDYEKNLQLLAKTLYVKGDTIGLLASAVGYYLRKTAEAVERANKIPSEYVGEVGKRIDITAQPVCVYSCDTVYGMTYIYKFVFNNNIFVWKTSVDLDVDATYTLRGTVKEHAEYRDEKQTVLARCKVLETKAA